MLKNTGKTGGTGMRAGMVARDSGPKPEAFLVHYPVGN
jgi:hypothetical protein